MASTAFKPVFDRIIHPIARVLLAIGLTPNAVTILGAVGSITSSTILISQGYLLLGSIVVTLFTLSDLFDGAMARISEHGSSMWGGFLDSTLDRLTDAAIMGGLIIYLVKTEDRLVYAAVISLVFGLLISYIRAKAESFGIPCSVGVAERTERLILVIAGIFLHSLNIPYALAISIIALAILSLITVVQRVTIVYIGLHK